MATKKTTSALRKKEEALHEAIRDEKFSTNKFAKKMKEANTATDIDIPPVQDWKMKKTKVSTVDKISLVLAVINLAILVTLITINLN